MSGANMKLVSLNVGLPRRSTLAGRHDHDRHLQRARQRARRLAQAESGRRPAGGSQRPRGRVESRLLLIRWRTTTYWGRESCRARSCRWAPSEKILSRQEGPLLEESVNLGDRLAVGSAEVVVTQPRLPCYKLGLRFQSSAMVKRFFASRRTGFYLAVTREGEVGAGDQIRVVARDPNGVPVSEILRLYTEKKYGASDVASLERLLQVAAVPENWKEYFRERLEERNA